MSGTSQAQTDAGDRLVLGPDDFRGWTFPQGLVSITSDGVHGQPFAERYNAVASAQDFPPDSIGHHGGTLIRAVSNATEARLVADQRLDTWWRPDPNDPVETWWLELDLGRTVVADRVRLVFPDAAGTRPFTYFAVYVSPGFPTNYQDNLSFTRINQPGELNTQPVVELALSTHDPGQAEGEWVAHGDTLGYQLVRFVRVEALARPAGAALAEIEVETAGYNVAGMLATRQRLEAGLGSWGGGTRAATRCGSTDAVVNPSLADGWWNCGFSGTDWRSRSTWLVVDLGSVFRINRLLWLPLGYGNLFQYRYQGTQGCQIYNGAEFLTSTGTPDPSADAEVEGPFRYDLLSSLRSLWPVRTYFDLRFAPRSMRYILWRMREGGCAVLQLWAFQAPGYPAQVDLESSDIEVGQGTSLGTVEWDADLPAGTHIEVESQTGDGYTEVVRYLLANGTEVTREGWEATKPMRRGPIVKSLVRDATWSSWSEPYRSSGQAFLSPTPRRWLRLRMHLVSDEPASFPVLRRLSFTRSKPLITQGVTGGIWPAEAGLDSMQAFVYTLTPGASTVGDPGYDRIRLELPWRVQEAVLDSVSIGGRLVTGVLRLEDGALVVDLPEVIRTAPVQLGFHTRLFRDPTYFKVSVLSSGYPARIQQVAPARPWSDVVFVPEIPARRSLLRSITHTEVFSPNGDGVNDEYHLQLIVVKTPAVPRVSIYRLDGSPVAELVNADVGGAKLSYTWPGTEAGGALVPPGAYLVRISIDAEASGETTTRVVSVAY